MHELEPIPSMDALFPAREGQSPEHPDRADAICSSALADAIRGHSVLVTGAGGSLGRVLARRLLGLPIGRLLLLDTSEQGLVQLQERLERRDECTREGSSENGGATAEPSRTYLLADLRLKTDRQRALREQPTLVIHAAAYKHVPFLENRPVAAVQNNVLATADWLQACRTHSAVTEFVLVSTDKAVRPNSVMGATKAAAERLTRVNSSGPASRIARLCNVFGSRGSVVPRFCRRLQAGEPLPVTHPDMERWFVSPDQAARAVLATLSHPPGTYVPRVRRRLRIKDLAHRLVRWVRSEASPEDWIRYVGLRAGERLQESLLAPEERPGLMVDGSLSQAQPKPQRSSNVWLEHCLAQIRESCRAGAPAAVSTYLHEMVAPSDSSSPKPSPPGRGAV